MQLGVRSGVVFLSYSSLISGCDNGATRMDQLCEWCGNNFDGLIVFDECHKAKNLVPESGAKPTKVGRMVLELQQRLPHARVVYCSATGGMSKQQDCFAHRVSEESPLRIERGILITTYVSLGSASFVLYTLVECSMP